MRRLPKTTIGLLVPMLPNFIRTESGGSMPVHEIPDNALRGIGKSWTALLLLKARNGRRASKKAARKVSPDAPH